MLNTTFWKQKQKLWIEYCLCRQNTFFFWRNTALVNNILHLFKTYCIYRNTASIVLCTKIILHVGRAYYMFLMNTASKEPSCKEEFFLKWTNAAFLYELLIQKTTLLIENGLQNNLLTFLLVQTLIFDGVRFLGQERQTVGQRACSGLDAENCAVFTVWTSFWLNVRMIRVEFRRWKQS